MRSSKITQKSQVTIPAYVRRELGMNTADSVRFVGENRRAYPRPVPAWLDAAFGIVKPAKDASSKKIDQAVRQCAAGKRA